MPEPHWAGVRDDWASVCPGRKALFPRPKPDAVTYLCERSSQCATPSESRSASTSNSRSSHVRSGNAIRPMPGASPTWHVASQRPLPCRAGGRSRPRSITRLGRCPGVASTGRFAPRDRGQDRARRHRRCRAAARLVSARRVAAARQLGWRPTRQIGWLLALSTASNDAVIRANRDALAQTFPGRHDTMFTAGQSLALIDPSNRRREWLLRTAVDGRRSPARYVDYADFMRRIA